MRDCSLALIDEMLRWTSPVHYFMRTAMQDTEIGVTAIRAGESLAFRADRSPNPHIAFGRGPHFCIGHQLARMEMRTIFFETVAQGRQHRVDRPGASRPLRAHERNHLAFGALYISLKPEAAVDAR